MTTSNDQLDIDCSCSVIDTADLADVQGGGGKMQGEFPPPTSTPSPTKPKTTAASDHPTELGNICRDAYIGLGAGIGAALTPEAGGLGSVPGTVVGGVVGRQVCPP